MSCSNCQSQSAMDLEQARLMEEECILVDQDDKPIGHTSKRICHQNSNILAGMLHRAFSVFLFNSRGELLLQQRSAAKVTFPMCWTNTCCSHPLHVESELAEQDNIGVKTAAIRKLNHELGIKGGPGALQQSDLVYLTRIHYCAPSDGQWGEHEIDHIMFIKKDVPLQINPNEVASVQYITADDLKSLLKSSSLITPWFEMICSKFLFSWWSQLDSIIANKGLPDPQQAKTIHRLSLQQHNKANTA